MRAATCFRSASCCMKCSPANAPSARATSLELLQQVIHAKPAPLNAAIPEPLRALVMKALEKNPADRYSVDARTGGGFARRSTSQRTVVAAPRSIAAHGWPRRARRHRRRGRRSVAGFLRGRRRPRSDLSTSGLPTSPIPRSRRPCRPMATFWPSFEEEARSPVPATFM